MKRFGAEVNPRDNFEATPLHNTCLKGHLQVAEFLSENGADVLAKNDRGFSPLYLACQERHLEVKVLSALPICNLCLFVFFKGTICSAISSLVVSTACMPQHSKIKYTRMAKRSIVSLEGNHNS